MTDDNEQTTRVASAATLATRAFARVQKCRQAIMRGGAAAEKSLKKHLARGEQLKQNLKTAEAELERLKL